MYVFLHIRILHVLETPQKVDILTKSRWFCNVSYSRGVREEYICNWLHFRVLQVVYQQRSFASNVFL